MSDRLRILLVEDNRLDAELFQQLVKRSAGFVCEIETRPNLQEAVAALHEGAPDLVVLDLNLPDSKGLDTFRRIRETVRVPVVIYSGAGDDSLTQQAVAAGAQDYIIKGESDTHSLTRSMRFAVERSRREESERLLAQQDREIELLHELQETLLPKFPEFSFRGLIATAVTNPAARGSGDYCDIIPMDESKFVCFVADVSGHGLRASQYMLSVRATIRAIAKYTRTASELILAADELLSDDFRDGHFVTLIIAVVDAESNTVAYASAGHRGYLIRAGGEVLVLESDCPPIGVDRLASFSIQDEVVSISPGDKLFLASDGIAESQNAEDQQFGEKRLSELLVETRELSPQETIRKLLDCERAFRGSQAQLDDITMVSVKCQPLGGSAAAEEAKDERRRV